MNGSQAAEHSERESTRSVVLVTGMSGSGKSTVLAELTRRGHRVVDTDDPGWIVETNTASGPEPLWDLDQIKTRIDGHRTGWLFIAGCVANQGAVYDRFDAVVLLSAPVEVILGRVADRANPFGSTAGDRTKIANDLAAFEPLLRAGADHEIDTPRPSAKSWRRWNTSRAAPVIETRQGHAGRIASDSPGTPNCAAETILISTAEKRLPAVGPGVGCPRRLRGRGRSVTTSRVSVNLGQMMNPAASSSDANLVLATARRDELAFALLYRRYLPLVLRWCVVHTGERELAADLAAETFAAALIAARRYRPEQGEVDAWLLGIARNKLRESRRRGRVEHSARKRLSIEPVAITDDDLERVDQLAMREEEILPLVHSLPVAQREALLGRVVGERSYRELAGELRCSEMVVRQRVSRGLRALRSRLEERL